MAAGRTTRTVPGWDGGTVRPCSSYVHEASAPWGLVLLLQYGSGAQLDEHLHQPAVDQVAEVVRAWAPAVLYTARCVPGAGPASRWRLWSPPCARWRAGSGQAVYVGDNENRVRPLSMKVAKHLFKAGIAGAAEALTIAQRTRAGMRSGTGRVLGPGRFTYALSGPLPPPFEVARLRLEGSDTVTRVAYVNAPGVRPTAYELRHQLSPLHVAEDLDDRLLDELALDRWLYQHYRRPRWGARECAAYILAQGHTTMGTQRLHRDTTRQPLLRPGHLGRSDAAKICQRILAARQFHLTGLLRLNSRGRRHAHPCQGGHAGRAAHLHPRGRCPHPRRRTGCPVAATSRPGAHARRARGAGRRNPGGSDSHPSQQGR